MAVDKRQHNREQIERIVDWLREQVDELPFGSISVALHLHKGLITRAETGVTESISTKTGGDHE
jgi:hypothetical protein